jgi:uncharacterized protein YndB with AHSA1/START domain
MTGTPTPAIDENAPVIARHSIVIHAPLEVVWRVHTDLESWPEWQSGVGSMELLTPGPLRPGSAFRWHVEGLDITSTVRQVVPQHRLVWGGPANGIVGVHVWEFTEQPGGGVLVRTEESWSGAPVEADIPYAQQALDSSLTTWLDNLRMRTEAS